MIPGLVTLAAVLTAVAGALLLIHTAGRGPVRVPPARPRRVQQALDETGDEAKAVIFDFPARPTTPPDDAA